MRTISPVFDGERPNLKITGVETHVLLAPDYDPGFTSSAQDSIVVAIHTDGGITGIGESDVNPWMAKACIEAPGTHTMGLSIVEMLKGADPFDIGKLWERMYIGTAMNGRRGVVIHAMGAGEMALWDLCGKALGQPVHRLLGRPARDHITPYASLQPAGHSFAEYRDALVDSALKAKGLGFKAVKSEVTMNGPYAHGGMRESYDRHTEVVAAVRKALGPDITLMVDVQSLDDADTCYQVVRDWGVTSASWKPDLADNVAEMARLAEKAPMKIAAGECWRRVMSSASCSTSARCRSRSPMSIASASGQARSSSATWPPSAGSWSFPLLEDGDSTPQRRTLLVTPHCAFIEYLPPAATSVFAASSPRRNWFSRTALSLCR